MFNPFKPKNEPAERKCILEHSINQTLYTIDGETFFNELEDASSTIPLGNYSFDQYIDPLIIALGQLINPFSSQQSSQHQFFFNQQLSHTPLPTTDPQKEQQIISEALNTIKTYVNTWTLKSLRKHYLQNYATVDKLLIELRRCFDKNNVTLEQQMIILYITHKFAIATCAPQLVMEVLTYGTLMLPEKNTSPAASIFSEFIPTNILKAKLHKRNTGAIITKILAITLEYYEKNSTFKLLDTWKGKLLMYEEIPFLITKDLKRLFETMRRFMMSRNNGSNGVKEKVSKTAMKYLYNLFDRNLLNLNWMKLSEANDQILNYITSNGIPDELPHMLTLDFLIVKEGEAASIMNLKRIFSERTDKEEDIKHSVSSAAQYFLRIMHFYHCWIDRNHDVNNFVRHHNLSRFNFIKDFFILSTEMVQNLNSKNLSLAFIVHDLRYFECLKVIPQVLERYRTTYYNDIESDLWVEMENSTRAYMEKVSSVHEDLISHMQPVQINIAFGLLNSPIQLPADWKFRSMSLHLGKVKKSIQDIDTSSTSELFEKMSISDCSDSKDSFCSSFQEDPSTMFSRIFPEDTRTIEHIDQIYFEMFLHDYYREEKYPWIENLCNDHGKRQIILFSLCSVLRILFLHCSPTSTDTLRRIHQEVENTISYKKNTNDYNSVSPKDLKNLLKDVLQHTDQLMQISTLNGYYKTIEEGHTIEYYAQENDVFEAIFQKKNHFTEMFRLTSLAHSFSRHLDYLLDENIRTINAHVFLGFPHRDVSLVFNLESCGIEVFQSIIFKLLNIHARYTNAHTENKIREIIQKLNSPYYRNIVMRCVMEAAVRIYFDRMTGDQEMFKNSMTSLSKSQDSMLWFYEDILNTGLKDSSMTSALISHAITTLKSYFTEPGRRLSFDSRLIILSNPSIFSSKECAKVIASRPDIMELLLHHKVDYSSDSLLYYMFRSSILKLAYEHSLVNPDILINNTDYSTTFKMILEQGLRQFNPNDTQDFNSYYDVIATYFRSAAKQSAQEILWGNIIESTDNMLLYLARYWILQKHPEILIRKELREFTLPLSEVIVYKADYYRRDVLSPHLGSIVLELISDLSSDKNLPLKPTTWLIGAVEGLSENSNINQEIFFDLFKASINRLANNETYVDLLVLLCRFLIKRSNTWETYLGQVAQQLQNSQLQHDLDRLRQKLENSNIKNTSITLHKYCFDLFQMVCIATRKVTFSDAVDLLNQNSLSLSSSNLFDSNGETTFFKTFNMLIQILKSNLNSSSSISTFSETYSNVLKYPSSVAMRNLNTSSLMPYCKYIQLLLESPLASSIIRNTNFSLFYCSNSNSKLLLTPCIKNTIPLGEKKKALVAELNIFAGKNQGISCTSGSLFLSKPVVTKRTVPLNYQQFLSNPITVFRQNISNMKYTHTDDYSYMLEVEGLFDDNTRHGIANIIIFNQVCERLQRILPTLVLQSDITSCYFVMGCLLGSSLLCKYYLGPLNIDQEILQSFVDGVSIPQGSPKFEMANSFVTGLRSVLGDDLANFLKVFTAQELISLTCDCNTISSLVNELLHQYVERDGDVNEETSKQFLNLLGTLLKEDIFVATLLLNYLDAIVAGMEGRRSFSLNIIPHDYKTLQINRSHKTVDISVCYTKEELKHMILTGVRIQK